MIRNVGEINQTTTKMNQYRRKQVSVCSCGAHVCSQLSEHAGGRAALEAAPAPAHPRERHSRTQRQHLLVRPRRVGRAGWRGCCHGALSHARQCRCHAGLPRRLHARCDGCPGGGRGVVCLASMPACSCTQLYAYAHTRMRMRMQTQERTHMRRWGL